MQPSILATAAQQFGSIKLLVKEHCITKTSIQSDKECFIGGSGPIQLATQVFNLLKRQMTGWTPFASRSISLLLLQAGFASRFFDYWHFSKTKRNTPWWARLLPVAVKR